MSYGSALVNKTREWSAMKIDIVSNIAINFFYLHSNERRYEAIDLNKPVLYFADRKRWMTDGIFVLSFKSFWDKRSLAI